MAKGMRAIKAGDLPGGIFRFAVTDVSAEAAQAFEHFEENQAEVWQRIRAWADDQEELVSTEDGGSPNGPGASLGCTLPLREGLSDLLRRHHVTSMLDVPCGDLNWMRQVDLTGITYIGWDVDPVLIERCRERTPAEWVAHYAVANILTEPELPGLPAVDLILCRDFLAHLPTDQISSVLDTFKNSGARFLLTSHYYQEDSNDFVYSPAAWTWLGYMERTVNLELPPFSLGPPLDWIEETPCPGGVPSRPHQLALFRLT